MSDNEDINPQWSKASRDILIAIFVGMILGWYLHELVEDDDNDYDYAIATVEGYLNLSEMPQFFKVRMNENSTLAYLHGSYKQFKPYADNIIIAETKRICKVVK